MRSYTYQEIIADPALIATINRVYHDVEYETYDASHPEILVAEKQPWRELVTTHVGTDPNCPPRNFLDIGTGTGFVVRCLEDILRPADTVIFSDISTKMLAQCQQLFASSSFQKKFIETDTTRIPLPDESVDVITINSVLHHIPDTNVLLRECRRLLAPGGVLVIKHEPNQLFSANALLRTLYLTSMKLRRFRNRRNTNRQKVTQSTDRLYDTVIKRLQDTVAMNCEQLSVHELRSVVDIHSPTAAGTLDRGRGFNPFELGSQHFPDDQVVHIKTYGYLGKIDEQATFMRRACSSMLRRLFPRHGYFFDIIIKKHDTRS